MAADLVTWFREQLAADPAGHYEVHDLFDCESAGVPSFPCTCGWPKRIEAEAAAKRSILELHSPAGITSDPPYKWACSVCHRRDGWWAGEYPCTTLRLLVAPFVSRAGFDPSWLD